MQKIYKIILLYGLVLILSLTGCSGNGTGKHGNSTNASPVQDNANNTTNSGKPEGSNASTSDTGKSSKTNTIDKDSVKVGDKIAGLTVKSVDIKEGYLNDITFSGEIEVSGTYLWADESGDGDGSNFVFTVAASSLNKLPVLESIQSLDTIVLGNDDNTNKILSGQSGKATIVIDSLSLGERQIPASAKLVKAYDIKGTTETDSSNIHKDTVPNKEKVSRSDALKIIAKWCERPDGNNGTIESFPKNDKVVNGVTYYYFNAVFTSGPAAQFFVDSRNGDIYAADYNGDVLIDDGTPLNKK